MLWLLCLLDSGADSGSVTTEGPRASLSTPELTVKWGTGPVQAEPWGTVRAFTPSILAMQGRLPAPQMRSQHPGKKK